MKRFFLFILPLFFFLSCGKEASHRFSLPRESRSGVLLTGLDSLVDANPDSALKVLDAAIKQEENKIGKSVNRTSVNLMRLELLRAKAKNKACVPFRADSLAVMQRVADYYHKKGNANDRMLSLYLLGCAYRDLGSAPRAIETWQQAVAEADTTRADCDLSTLMRIHSQMADMFNRQRLYDYMQKEDSIAATLCWMMRDTFNALLFESEVCNTLFIKGEYEACIHKTDSFRNAYLHMDYRNKAALVCVYALKSYLALGEYTKAKPYLDIYGAYCLSESDRRKIDGGLAPYYIYRGNYYIGIGNLDSAEYCFRQAMPEMMVWNNDVAVYKGLQKVYELKFQSDSVLKYSNLYGKAKEYSYEATMNIATLEAKNLYDYSVEQREVQKEREKRLHMRTLLYFIISSAFTLLLLMILFLYYRWYIKKKEKEAELDKLTIEVQNIKMEKQQKENEIQRHELLQGKFKKDLLSAQQQVINLHKKVEKLKQEKKDIQNSKNDLLAKTEKKYHEMIDKQNGKIAELQTKQEESKRKLDELISIEANEKIENSNIVKKFLNAIQNNSVNNISEEDWRKLRATVEVYYPGFYKAMNQRKFLRKDQYRACLLTRVGCFTPSDLERLLNWSYNSASKKRQQLLKKVFNMKGSSSDFDRMVRDYVSPPDILLSQKEA